MWGEKGTGGLHQGKEAIETFCASPLCMNAVATGIFLFSKELADCLNVFLTFKFIFDFVK